MLYYDNLVHSYSIFVLASTNIIYYLTTTF